MKILLVNKFHYLNGGSEKYYFELGKLLKKHGNEVAYFSMEDDRNIRTGDKEFFVKKIDLNYGSKLKALDVIYSKDNYKKMEEAIKEFRPDVIHFNNFQRQLSASVVEAGWNAKIPMIFTAHDMEAVCPNKDMLYNGRICDDCITKGYMSCIKKKCIKNSKLKSILGVIEMKYYKLHSIYEKFNYIVSPSEFMKKCLLNGGVKNQNIEVIHNFSNATNCNNEINGDYIFYFGRISKEKGIFNLIGAVKKCDEVKLLIAGTGPEEEKIKKYIKENKMESRVVLLGYLNQDEIRERIEKCRFVVIPSIWYENCPYSIIETLEIGKPIIASEIGGIPEIVENEKNGLLYRYDSVDDLADKINELYYNQEKINKMKESSKNKFKMEHTEDVYYQKIMKIYKNAIGEKND